jgi:hypothetical protein
MSGSDRQLLSFGVFLIILVVGILLVLAGAIGWDLFAPVVLVLYGSWTVALAILRSNKPQKYQRDATSTVGVGLALVALGGAWYIFRFGWLYSLVVLLLAVAVLAIAVAIRHK